MVSGCTKGWELGAAGGSVSKASKPLPGNFLCRTPLPWPSLWLRVGRMWFVLPSTNDFPYWKRQHEKKWPICRWNMILLWPYALNSIYYVGKVFGQTCKEIISHNHCFLKNRLQGRRIDLTAAFDLVKQLGEKYPTLFKSTCLAVKVFFWRPHPHMLSFACSRPGRLQIVYVLFPKWILDSLEC